MKNLFYLLLGFFGCYCWDSPAWDLSAVSKYKCSAEDILLKGKDKSSNVKVRAAAFFMPMQDKVGLYTLIAAPVGLSPDEKYPIVFIRDPYSKDNIRIAPKFFSGKYASWLRRGYAVVLQHCRGTGASEGEFIPYVNERADGLETLRLIRQLPFYNAEIFLTGKSYLSTVHYTYLSAAPDDIKGAVLLVQGIDRSIATFHNNILRLSTCKWGFTQYRKKAFPDKKLTDDSFRNLPLADLSRKVFGKSVPDLDDRFSNFDPASPYWNTTEGCSVTRDALKNYRFPILFIGGLYDIYTEDNFRMWRSLSPEQRKNSAMIMTPYDHSRSTVYNPKVHPVNFEKSSLDVEWPDYCYDFFEYCRDRRKPLKFIKPGNMTYYALWEKEWVTAPDLVNGPEKLTLFLGDRTLQNFSGSGSLTYRYDPSDPARFAGNCTFRMSPMAKQHRPNWRSDVISFISEPMEKPFKVRGRMSALINVRSDCEDTAFYLRISVIKNDDAYCMREDITPISKQHPDYQAGSMVPLKFDFTDHAFGVEKGDRLRLDISSSCWPSFVPHTNFKGNQFYHTTYKVANNTVEFANSSITLYIQP